MGFKGLAILFSSLKIKTHRNVLNLVLFKIPNGQSYFPHTVPALTFDVPDKVLIAVSLLLWLEMCFGFSLKIIESDILLKKIKKIIESGIHAGSYRAGPR